MTSLPASPSLSFSSFLSSSEEEEEEEEGVDHETEVYLSEIQHLVVTISGQMRQTVSEVSRLRGKITKARDVLKKKRMSKEAVAKLEKARLNRKRLRESREPKKVLKAQIHELSTKLTDSNRFIETVPHEPEPALQLVQYGTEEQKRKNARKYKREHYAWLVKERDRLKRCLRVEDGSF